MPDYNAHRRYILIPRKLLVIRIALANLRFPASPAESVTLAEQAIQQAALAQAHIVCFPECYIPGLRGVGKNVATPDPAFLDQAHAAIAHSAAQSSIAV